MSRKKITVRKLQRADVCQAQIDIFKREWPRGCFVTKKNVLRAAEVGLWVGDAASYLLKESAYHAYHAAVIPATTGYAALANVLHAYNAMTEKEEAVLVRYIERAEALCFWEAWRKHVEEKGADDGRG